jgi:hypothetical protein
VIGRADEGRHAPGPEDLWGESWYFDFATADASFGGYVRLGLYPNIGVAWWWAHLAGAARPTVVVRDHEVPMPTGSGLDVRAGGLWAQTVCETPHEHWTITMEAFGVALDHPADAYHGELGRQVPVGLDVEWEATAPVYEYPGVTRYEQPCRVQGHVLVGDERIEVDATGERDHSWGVRDWWLFPWCWTAGRLADDTAFHASKIVLDQARYEPGFISPPGGGELHAIEGFSVDTELGDEMLPVSATMHLGPLRLSVTPVAHAPVLLVAPDGRVGRFPRSLCRFVEADGRQGAGWTEWNQPQPA